MNKLKKIHIKLYEKSEDNLIMGLYVFTSMGKIGYAPKWGSLHTKVYKEFDTKSGEQGEYSPTFTDVDKAMKWLHVKKS